MTYLPATVGGQWFHLYLILDLYSRKIVGWEVLGRRRRFASGLTGLRLQLAQTAGKSAMSHQIVTNLRALQKSMYTASFSRGVEQSGSSLGS